MKVANETMPIGVAYIKTFLEKNLESHVQCKIFRYPDKLLDAIDLNPPDVLMVSSYIWNESLSLFLIKYAKSVNPYLLSVMGGPNFSLEASKQEKWLRNNPTLDIFIIYEGEKPALNLINKFIEVDSSVNEVKKMELDSCIFIRPDGSFHLGKWNSNLQDLNEIPSPWLSGDLDEFFDGKLAPIIETVRGCPFTCAFCVQGTEFYKKLRRFPAERLGKEVDYIGKKIVSLSPSMGFLCLADSNFGMFKEDIVFSKFVGLAQRKYKWPTYIDATTGKNKKDTIMETVSNLNGALVMYTSVQTMDTVTLENVKRRNIKTNIMRDLQQEAESKGIKTLTETILGLPGETFESHKEGIFELIKMGIKQFTNYQFMILKGAEMEQTEAKEKFGIRTAYRILPRNWGKYREQKIFEIEEIADQTSTLPYKDYLRARKFHLTMMIYYNGFYFEPLIRFLEYNGVRIEVWLNELNSLVYEEGGIEIRKIFNDFNRETENELFKTHKDCVDFYSEEKNFQRLKRGQVGGNLLMKYRAEANFHNWEYVVEYGLMIARKILDEKRSFVDSDLLNCVNEIEVFILNRVAHGKKKKAILSESFAIFNYDIKKWIEENYVRNLLSYKYLDSKEEKFQLSEEKNRILSNALEVYGEDIVGKAMLSTRVQYADFIKEVTL